MLWNWQKYSLFMVMVLGTVTLAGCMGQKYGFPGFGAKQASTTEAKISAEQEASQATKDSEWNHVAQIPTNDKSPLIVPASSNQESSVPVNVSAGKIRISDLPHSPINQRIDQAFQETPSVVPAASRPELDQEVSSLRALKASLDQLSNQETVPSASEEQAGDAFSRYLSDQKNIPVVATPSAAKEPFGIAILSEPNKPSGQSLDFPWAKSDKIPERGKSQIYSHKHSYGLETVRGMLKKTRVLIQQNNLLDARMLAEAASLLKKKTEAVFSSEEVTPEQILAEIAGRERQRKEKLLASYGAAGQSSGAGDESSQAAKQQKKQVAPVVIDLSRDWINHELTGRAGQFDDVANFERSIAQLETGSSIQANHGAHLPLIMPSDQQADARSAGQFINNVRSNSENRLSNPAHSPVLFAPGSTRPENPSVEHTSYLPPQLPFGEESAAIQTGRQTQSSGYSNNAPLLIAPGLNTKNSQQNDTQFNQFAASFDGATATDASEIGQAPLLIDEAELQVQEAAESSPISSTMLSLIVCGIAMASFLLIRWRR